MRISFLLSSLTICISQASIIAPCFAATEGSSATHKVKFGAYVHASDASVSGREGALIDFESKTKGKLAIAHYYLGFEPTSMSTKVDPLEEAQWALSKGMIPLVSLHGGNSIEIKNGTYDNYLEWLGGKIKACKGPVLLRYAYEMDNAHVEPYVNLGTPEDNQNFVKAWQRIHTLIKKTAGATNCEFVWCPTAYGYKNHFDKVKQMYPGSSYVYFIGCDGYNREQPQAKSAEEIFKPYVQLVQSGKLDAESKSKPLMICETGTTGDDQQKADWLKNLGAWTTRVPQMWAVTYWDSMGMKDWDYRLTPGKDNQALKEFGALENGR